MTKPFRPDPQPGPRWMNAPDGGDDAPTFQSAEQRIALDHLIDDWLDPVDIVALFEKGVSDGPEAEESVKAYEQWLEATKTLRTALSDYYDALTGEEETD